MDFSVTIAACDLELIDLRMIRTGGVSLYGN